MSHICEVLKNIESTILLLERISNRANELKSKLEWFKKIVGRETKEYRDLDIRDFLDAVIGNDEETLDFFKDMRERLEDITFDLSEYQAALDDEN